MLLSGSTPRFYGEPDDWLAYSPTRDAAALIADLRSVHSTAPLVVADVTCASIVMDLSGPGALEVLMRDCTLDLEGNAVNAGDCAQTVMAQVGVLIYRPRDTDVWRIFVDRSTAVHLWEYLVDSATLLAD